jgi:hypothetical protein
VDTASPSGSRRFSGSSSKRGDDRAQRAGQRRRRGHAPGVALSEPVQRAGKRQLHSRACARAAARAQQREQRGHQGQGRGQAHEHAGAGDQAQLRDPGEAGRQEREESGAGGERAQRDRDADIASGPIQGIAMDQPVAQPFAVAQREVHRVVHAQADVEHRKGHRDHVQVTDGGGGEGGRPQQAGQQRDQRRAHQAHATEPERQHQRDPQQCE